jgi:hypothetical protein
MTFEGKLVHKAAEQFLTLADIPKALHMAPLDCCHAVVWIVGVRFKCCN